MHVKPSFPYGIIATILFASWYLPIALCLGLSALACGGPADEPVAEIAQEAAAAHRLVFSRSASRVSPTVLDGQTLTGAFYIFVDPPTGASVVEFFLDDDAMARAPLKREGIAPFDFNGTANDGSAIAWDPAGLADGSHSIVARVTLTAGGTEVLRATLAKGSYSVVVSAAADRSGAVPLAGAALSGNRFIFTRPDTDVTRVDFFLDDPTQARAPLKQENAAPFDFAGTAASGGANPWNSSSLSAGAHTISARVTRSNGTSVVLNASFQVGAGTPPPPPPSRGAVKWHPGHYVYAQTPYTVNSDSTLRWDSGVEAALNSPYFQGVQVRAMWNRDELEPRRGTYNFTKLQTSLNHYKAKGKRMTILMIDQDYWGFDCTPRYMRDPSHPDYSPIYKGGQVKSGKRCVPKLWVPAVMDRTIALYTAIGQRFDADPYFEGLSSTETAIPSLGDPDYSNDAIVTQLIRLSDAMPAAFPRSIFWLHANWTQQTQRVVQNAFARGLGIDGPDLTVIGPRDPSQKPNWGYACFNQSMAVAEGCTQDYYGRMPLGMAGQVGLENSIKDGYTMAEIFAFAMTSPTGLRLTHMFWTLPYETPGFSFTGTILPYVESVRGRVDNVGCPENLGIRGGCTSN